MSNLLSDQEIDKVAYLLRKGLHPEDSVKWKELSDDRKNIYRSALNIVLEQIGGSLKSRNLELKEVASNDVVLGINGNDSNSSNVAPPVIKKR